MCPLLSSSLPLHVFFEIFHIDLPLLFGFERTFDIDPIHVPEKFFRIFSLSVPAWFVFLFFFLRYIAFSFLNSLNGIVNFDTFYSLSLNLVSCFISPSGSWSEFFQENSDFSAVHSWKHNDIVSGFYSFRDLPPYAHFVGPTFHVLFFGLQIPLPGDLHWLNQTRILQIILECQVELLLTFIRSAHPLLGLVVHNDTFRVNSFVVVWPCACCTCAQEFVQINQFFLEYSVLNTLHIHP